MANSPGLPRNLTESRLGSRDLFVFVNWILRYTNEGNVCLICRLAFFPHILTNKVDLIPPPKGAGQLYTGYPNHTFFCNLILVTRSVAQLGHRCNESFCLQFAQGVDVDYNTISPAVMTNKELLSLTWQKAGERTYFASLISQLFFCTYRLLPDLSLCCFFRAAFFSSFSSTYWETPNLSSNLLYFHGN